MEKFREVTETHLVATDYQIRQLREIQPVTPLFNSISQNKTEHKDKIIAPISINLRDQIYNLTAKNLVNKLALYLAAIQFLILKYTAQEEFVLATGALNIETSDSLIFCRFNQQNLKSFKDLLKITRSHLQEGYRHQNYDLNSLIETFLARGGNLETIFDIVVIQGGFSSHSSLLNKFQLVFEIEATDSSVSVTFSPDTFQEDFVQRMLGHFLQILEIVTINPDVELREIDILTPGEREQLLIKWNNTQTEYPADKCIHQLFEEQAKRTPNAIAVVYENESLTYQELNNRGNQLAHNLQKLGVKPDTLVGICLERSLELVVGLLAILKAGGAYVPIDPHYPQERLTYLLADTQVKILLTSQSLTSLLPANLAKIICLDSDWDLIAKENPDNFESGVTVENLAYVIYTSGSTGQPKGAMNCHRGVVNRLLWMQDTYPLTQGDRILQKTPFSFDVSVWEFFWPLLTGARLVVAKPEGHKDSVYLIKLIQDQQITTLHFVPSMLRVLLQEADLEKCQSLKRVICSGEALPNDLSQRFFERFNCELHNLYGPTEAAIDVTYWACSPNWKREVVPIGRPVANTQIYLLNADLQPVPIGVVGELHIGGVQLARGYFNRPELTAEKFIANPFYPSLQKEQGSTISPRLYKTGDLARYLPDGNIEFLGRLDHQVKIRGFRIELGEIETILGQHPDVCQSVVLAHQTETGSQTLIAYVVSQSQTRQHLSPEQEPHFFDEQIGQWQTLYNQTYRQSVEDSNPLFNTVGWNSSYTGEPIPAAEMDEWLKDKTATILAHRPQRVLEIGCGTGLILFQVAPHCDRYWGTDISVVGLDLIRHHLGESKLDLAEQVNLLQRPADDFEGLEAEAFDTIILNSVVQYFPHIDYLVKVLEKAIAAIAPGGRIFLGDVRNLKLLAAFHASVELTKADPDISVDQWQKRVERQIAQEQELLIDPAFFTALQQRFPQITQVDIQLPRSQYENELTQFRYNVVLQINTKAEVEQSETWLAQEAFTIPELSHLLEKTQPPVVGIKGLTNLKLVAPLTILEFFKHPQDVQTVETLQSSLQKLVLPNPETELDQLAETFGYSLLLTYADSQTLNHYDAIFVKEQRRKPHRAKLTNLSKTHQDWQQYANHPLQPQLNRQLIPQLRSYLETRLPEYMIPNAFVLLAEIPLTPNGKLDRRALPSPEQIRLELTDTFVAPCTPIEEMLALIWAEILGLEQIGIHDNFFELGGDSIRGIQVIAKARTMGFEFSLPELLQHQTIQELAHLVSRELNPVTSQKTEVFSLISAAQRLSLPPDIEDAYPLTALQLGMIFHSEYQGNVPVYHDVFTYHIRTVFNYTVLHQTIQEIAARHGILRTSFALTDYAEPLQLVHHQVEIPLALADLSSLTSLEQEAALDDWIEREKSHPFDWQVPPLLRFHIHLRSTETFNLTLSFHHSILDGWSVASLLTELLQQYLYRLGQNILPLAAPPTINFRDFVALEQTILKSQPCQEYWQKQLEDLTITPLPEWPEVSQKNKNWDWLVPIPTEVSQSLKRLGKKAGVPLKSVLLAAHLRVLSLLNNQTDVLTGLVSNGRLEETDGERVLGLFLNTLPLRLQLTGGTWLDLVRQVFATERDSLAWRRYPLAELQKRLGGQPLFDTAFNFVHFHIYQAIIGVQDLEVLGGKFFNQTNFTLLTNFSLHPLSGEVELTLKYDGDRLGQAQMERMAGYYQKVLTAIAQNPSQSFQDLCLLSDEEQAQILWDWNRTQTDLPPQQCVHQLFEIQVERSPDAVAIVWNQERLTYRQLNEQANQVAHYLQNLGVESESLVGICLERSLSLVVGLLGILKAGGAYVPLDPHYPTERLELILTDSQVPVLLTQQTLLSHLSHYSGDRVVLDRDAAIIAQQPKTNPKSQVSSSNSVYVIYTSGSTGKPKGVVIEHRSTVTLLDWARTVFSFDELAGVLASTSVCFDLSVFELFLPLTVGGAVILADNALALPNLAAATEVTLINTVPTAIAQLLALEAIPQSVRTVNLAGEPLSNSLVQKLYQLPQIERVYNLYGPSEDTTYSTFSCIEKGATTQPSIGRPIAHSQVYLLNATHQPVPLGTIGELYMGGAGLARGYLHRPELTAEKFIANPFHSPLQKYQGLSPSPKLYKTGDLARYRPDGNLEFLGRSDYQIKLRGFRIELGEIEVVLENCPGVKQAVVLRREDLVGGAKLVAYVVSENSTLTTQDLRRFLEQQLPDYMIPGFFVPLESFPLTPNGKVNRPALPRPEMELIPDGDFAAPQTAQEQILATIWQNVLGIQQVGRGDRFFELGGDSILSLQVVAQARQAGLKITPRQIFRYPSLAELAACCDIDSIGDTPNFSRTLTHQGLVTGEVPLTPIQKWFFEQNRSDSHHFNQSVLLNVPAQTQPTLLSQALSHLLQHHDALRLRFNLKQGQWQQDHGEITETVPLAVIDLSSIAPDQQFQRLEAIATEQQASFNLAEGKLMRVVLFQLGGQQGNRLLIILHHLVVDGVSWRVLLEDLWTAYQQLENQKTVQLPPKTLAFRDWALLLTTSAQEQTLQKELSYWLNQPWSTVMPLPLIHPPEKRSHPVAEVAEITVTLNVEKTRALLQQVPSVFNTQINDVLLTALAQTLTAWTGNSTILLDLEGHGREEGLAEVDVSRTVGWFTSLFPVILQLPDSNHPGESLKSIKEQLRMIPNHGIGYGILRYLSPDANVRTQMAALPKRDIIFNYLGQFDGGQSQATPWQLAPESKGANHGSADAPSHWLEINARVIGGQLEIIWSYARHIHDKATVVGLAENYLSALLKLIDYCLSPVVGGFTPSDFPVANLNQQELDEILAELD